MRILITGARGFLGRNLTTTLENLPAERAVTLLPIDVDSSDAELCAAAREADFVFHLAGVNRPKDAAEFQTGNADFTARLLALLAEGKRPPVALCSSTQAALENPYGLSKRRAEEAVFAYGERYGATVCVYRLTNVFGKWSRPNYNSAVATFCYRIARGEPITVNDERAVVKLVYVDDVVAEFLRALDGRPTREGAYCRALPERDISLGELTGLLYGFRDSRENLNVPDQSDDFVRKLYATYQSFLPVDGLAAYPTVHADARGSFTELFHLGGYGQVSVNVSHPGVTKGEHWHHTKHEKFAVVAGQGVIRFRPALGGDIMEYPVRGDRLAIIDIPPGLTHNIQNTGDTDMVTVMWASEAFDPERPDTFRLPVEPAQP